MATETELMRLPTNIIANSDKNTLTTIVDAYLEKMGRDGGDPIVDLALCKKLGYFAAELEKGLKQYAFRQLELQDNREAKMLGTTLKVVNGTPTYDYSATPSWVKLKAEADQKVAELKKLEEFLKKLPQSLRDVTPEGEEIMYYPPVKKSEETIRVTIG